MLISVGVTALISGATIGGKALGKPFAMNQSKRWSIWQAGFCICFIAAESLLIHTAAGGHCDSGFHSFP